jgi:WD40 repeat protein
MTGWRCFALALAVLLTAVLAGRGEGPAGHGLRVVAFSPDGRLLAAGTGEPQETGEVIVWDVASGQVRFRHTEKTGVPALAFAPDGRTLAIGVYDRAARLLDVATGRVRRTFPHPREVRTVAFSPDGLTLATACWDRAVRLWDVASGVEKRVLAGHTDRVWTVAFSPDGKLLVSAAGNGGAKLWDPATGSQRHAWKHGGFYVRCALFTADGRGVLTGGYDGTVRLWDVSSGQLRARFHNLGGVEGQALAPATGTLAVCDNSKDIKLFHLNLGEPTAQERARIRELLARLDDNSYEVREAASKELLAVGLPAEPELRQALKESPSAEVRIRARRLRAELLSRPQGVLTGLPNRVETLAFTPDGKRLASGGKDGAVRLWDVAGRKEVARLVPEGQGVPP